MVAETEELEIKDFEQIPDGVESLFIKREIERDNRNFKKSQSALFVFSMLLSLILLFSVYFFSSISKVKSISIIGNNYLKRQYIQNISGISLNSVYYCVIPNIIVRRLEADEMIKKAYVTLLADSVIRIEVEEQQPVGYRYSKDVAEVLFSDGKTTNLTKDYMPVISRVPFIIGFDTDTQTHLLTQGLAKLKSDMIESISEIKQYNLGFDQQALQLQMRTGGYFFANYFSLEVLNNYNAIYSKMKDRNQCLFADGGKKVAYAKSCPWDEPVITYDYWMNEKGEYILNQWGDKVIKRYYQDPEGNYYLDKTGNYILIPIDKRGNEIRDNQFIDHYQNGYYDTGVLLIPEETANKAQG